LVIDMLCSGDGDAGPVRQRVFWGVTEGAVAATLIVLGGEAGLQALQEVITVIGLPIFILVSLMIVTLVMGLRAERVKVQPLTHEQFLTHNGKSPQTESERVRSSKLSRDSDDTAPPDPGTGDDKE
jgi:choline/glycine/proline betaine transport protein